MTRRVTVTTQRGSSELRTEDVKRIRKALKGNRTGLQLLKTLLEVSDALNYGCNQCFHGAVLIDAALRRRS